MADFSDLQKRVVEFRDARDWKQFHNPKDMAISMVLEASEFLEHFQWKTPEEIKKHLKEKHDDVSDELVDVLYWVLLIANDLKIDLTKEFTRKMTKNDKKYPISKSKGTHKKYSEL
jgi:NTP pyrophosphatase (non-canonical NTP hydrolase)